MGESFINLIVENLTKLDKVFTIPILCWIVWELLRQRAGLRAALRVELKDLHDKALKEIQAGKQVSACYVELFYITYVEYKKLGGNGQADYWKQDFDRWSNK